MKRRVLLSSEPKGTEEDYLLQAWGVISTVNGIHAVKRHKLTCLDSLVLYKVQQSERVVYDIEANRAHQARSLVHHPHDHGHAIAT